MDKRTIKKCFYRDYKGYCQRELESPTAIKKCKRICKYYSEHITFLKSMTIKDFESM